MAPCSRIALLPRLWALVLLVAACVQASLVLPAEGHRARAPRAAELHPAPAESAEKPAQAWRYCLRARWMDPSTGRFVSEDPYEGEEESPVSLHRFLYANGGPITGVDPTGEMTFGELMQSNAVQGVLQTMRTVSYRTLSRGMSLVQKLQRFFWDGRKWKSISRAYWKANGPAKGQSLHHWLIPRSASRVPDGFKNAGWNLLRMPKVINFPGGLNSWMGFAQSWGGKEAFAAMVVENGLRVGIAGVAAGVGTLAYLDTDYYMAEAESYSSERAIEFMLFGINEALKELGVKEDD